MDRGEIISLAGALVGLGGAVMSPVGELLGLSQRGQQLLAGCGLVLFSGSLLAFVWIFLSKCFDENFLPLDEACERLREEALKTLPLGYSVGSFLAWRPPQREKELRRLAGILAETRNIYYKRPGHRRWTVVDWEEISEEEELDWTRLGVIKAGLQRTIRKLAKSRKIY